MKNQVITDLSTEFLCKNRPDKENYEFHLHRIV